MPTSDYKELKVWQKSIDLTVSIYEFVKTLPREETYALSDQMRRAVVSIPSNIAEGHGRISDKDCIKFLSIARGSLLEVETQIIICNRLNYISNEKTTNLIDSITEISKMINGLIKYRRGGVES